MFDNLSCKINFSSSKKTIYISEKLQADVNALLILLSCNMWSCTLYLGTDEKILNHFFLIKDYFHRLAKPCNWSKILLLFQDSAAFVRIWKKDDMMLFTGTVQISRDASMARFKLDPLDNTTLVKNYHSNKKVVPCNNKSKIINHKIISKTQS